MTEEPGLGKHKLLSSAMKKKNVPDFRFSGPNRLRPSLLTSDLFKSRTFVHGQVIGLIAFDQVLRLFS
jgi:hypothetical protein